MKKITKTILSFVLIFCSLFLIACNKDTKTELDYKVKVNTQSSNYIVQEDKSVISDITDPSSDNYLDISQLKGLKMTMTVQILGINYMDLTAIATNSQEEIEIAIKMSMLNDLQQKINVESYFKENKYYTNSGTNKIYYDFDESEINIEDIENMENMGNVLVIAGMALDSASEAVTTALEHTDTILQIAEDIAGSKTTKKIKINYTSEYNSSISNEIVIVVENGALVGIYLNCEVEQDTIATINLVPYEKDIPFPSFDKYSKVEF